MAWVERLVTRTTQPQDACGIDWSNPITQGLISWLEAGGPSGALVKTPSRLGVALQSQASTGSGLVLPSAKRNTGSGTLLLLADSQANLTYGEYFWDGTGASNRDLFYQLGPSAGVNSAKFGWYLNSVLVADNNQFPIGEGFFGSGAAFLSWATGVQKAYIGGIVSHQWSRTVAAGPERGIRVGSRFNSIDNLTSSKLVQRAEWNRALSDAEIKSLNENPWAIFEPETVRVWVDSAASVSLPTLVQPNATTSSGAWTATGAATLHAAINELVPSDTQYISVNSASTTELVLAESAHPGAANQTLAYRASSTQGSTLTVTLKQGVTTIMTRTHALTGTDTLYTQTLTGGEIALITAGPISVTLTTS